MKFSVITAFLAIAATSLFQSALAQNAAEQATGFVGTYTNGSSKSRGIYAISSGTSVSVPRLDWLQNLKMHLLLRFIQLVRCCMPFLKSEQATRSRLVLLRIPSAMAESCQTQSAFNSWRCCLHVTVDPTGAMCWGCELHRRQLYSVSDFRRWLTRESWVLHPAHWQ